MQPGLHRQSPRWHEDPTFSESPWEVWACGCPWNFSPLRLSGSRPLSELLLAGVTQPEGWGSRARRAQGFPRCEEVSSFHSKVGIRNSKAQKLSPWVEAKAHSTRQGGGSDPRLLPSTGRGKAPRDGEEEKVKGRSIRGPLHVGRTWPGFHPSPDPHPQHPIPDLGAPVQGSQQMVAC